MGRRLREYAGELEAAIGRADAHGQALSETFRSEADALDGVARRASSDAGQIADLLKDAAAELSRSGVNVQRHSEEVRDRLAEHLAGVEEAPERATGRTGKARGALGRTKGAGRR